ncbi:hypothetical protein A33Q_3364 [Indibacter alkaliphilus LW1]|uniref:Uncharacterized protein n=1 Tax=Indibacter alkaliphilus (strain CCUG 57479 / KCTC 22604 / LW1) TaxID=1189612 RepID=S2D8C2_INDAL|nr:peptidase S8 [Indibacter alkaliphilus]EOZ95159.1 hypothetical protein A33Q_3364 [Indibacter alkaliphilus LW1]
MPTGINNTLAALIGGKNYGVAKGVKLVGLNFLFDQEVDLAIYLSTYIQSLDWILANASGPSIIVTSHTSYQYEPLLEDAIFLFLYGEGWEELL